MSPFKKVAVAALASGLTAGGLVYLHGCQMPPPIPHCQEDEVLSFKEAPYTDANNLVCVNIEELNRPVGHVVDA